MQLEEKLECYERLLLKWQSALNLVGSSTLSEVKKRHFEDSLQLLNHIPEGTKTLYDLGSGAGFPGLVLAMARPDVRVHLIESDARKCQFLRTISRETQTAVTVHTERIEQVSLPSPGVITARALAELSLLLTLTRKWWEESPQMTLLFPKGQHFQEELRAAQNVYRFDYKMIPSETDDNACILLIRSVSVL